VQRRWNDVLGEQFAVHT